MKKIFLLMLIVFIFCGHTEAQIVTAKQVNGTWSYRNNQILVLALGNNKLKVQFDLAYEYKSPNGPTANVGFAIGEADIEGIVAMFTPPEMTGCKITMKFTGGKLIVTQEGSDADCGFGHNVTADGTYKKTSSAKPKFDEDR